MSQPSATPSPSDPRDEGGSSSSATDPLNNLLLRITNSNAAADVTSWHDEISKLVKNDDPILLGSFVTSICVALEPTRSQEVNSAVLQARGLAKPSHHSSVKDGEHAHKLTTHLQFVALARAIAPLVDSSSGYWAALRPLLLPESPGSYSPSAGQSSLPIGARVILLHGLLQQVQNPMILSDIFESLRRTLSIGESDEARYSNHRKPIEIDPSLFARLTLPKLIERIPDRIDELLEAVARRGGVEELRMFLQIPLSSLPWHALPLATAALGEELNLKLSAVIRGDFPLDVDVQTSGDSSDALEIAFNSIAFEIDYHLSQLCCPDANFAVSMLEGILRELLPYGNSFDPHGDTVAQPPDESAAWDEMPLAKHAALGFLVERLLQDPTFSLGASTRTLIEEYIVAEGLDSACVAKLLVRQPTSEQRRSLEMITAEKDEESWATILRRANAAAFMPRALSTVELTQQLTQLLSWIEAEQSSLPIPPFDFRIGGELHSRRDIDLLVSDNSMHYPQNVSTAERRKCLGLVSSLTAIAHAALSLEEAHRLPILERVWELSWAGYRAALIPLITSGSESLAWVLHSRESERDPNSGELRSLDLSLRHTSLKKLLPFYGDAVHAHLSHWLMCADHSLLE